MKVILFGATGMVGQAVLHECLHDDRVELVVGRRTTGRTHSKLRESFSKDLFAFDAAIEDLRLYDACFFCLGVSSAGMSEPDYTPSHLRSDHHRGTGTGDDPHGAAGSADASAGE
jgi:nucleoside-diphosphate-sugar epimerase